MNLVNVRRGKTPRQRAVALAFLYFSLATILLKVVFCARPHALVASLKTTGPETQGAQPYQTALSLWHNDSIVLFEDMQNGKATQSKERYYASPLLTARM